jgi:hypothetical protein
LLLQLRDGAQADQLATELRGKERTPLEVVQIRDFPGGGLVLHLVRTDDAPGTDAARRGRTNRR